MRGAAVNSASDIGNANVGEVRPGRLARRLYASRCLPLWHPRSHPCSWLFPFVPSPLFGYHHAAMWLEPGSQNELLFAAGCHKPMCLSSLSVHCESQCLIGFFK